MEYAAFKDVKEAIEWRKQHGGIIFLDHASGEATWFRLGIRPSAIMLHPALTGKRGELFIATSPPAPPAELKPFQVCIYYTADVSYQAMVTVMAKDSRDAADRVKNIADNNGLAFTQTGTSHGPYGYEVSTEGGPTESWQDE